MLKPYLNEHKLAFFINLSVQNNGEPFNFDWVYYSALVKKDPDFISTAYLEYNFKITEITYFPLAEQPHYEDEEEKEVENASTEDATYQKTFKTIQKNLKSKKPLFEDLLLNEEDLACLCIRLEMTVKQTPKSRKTIDLLLNEYLASYENGNLYREHNNTVQPSFHLNKFVEVIQYFSNMYGRNHVKIDIRKGFDRKSTLQAKKDEEELPYEEEFRFTEFFLSMQKKGYIEILDIRPLDHYSVYPFEYVINILRDPREILALEEKWLSYGTLCLQPVSGHVFNSSIKPRLAKNSAPFKLVEVLIQNPEKRFSEEELENLIFVEDVKSASKKQSETRIQDASKRARTSLKMNAVESSVNIFSQDGSVWLGPVPNRR